jgi:hypothetical protein
VRVTRFTTNPLVTVQSSATLGGNVNGPTVIRVPDWVERPLGRYYMYKESFIRVFARGGGLYGMARLGVLLRAPDALASVEVGPNAFRDTAYGSTRVRHVALVPSGNRLLVFFTAIGDAPERMLMSTIDMTTPWTDWKAGAPVDVMQPERDYECANLPIAKSAVGDIFEPARQIRDPHVLEDEGRTYLFYVTCGEQGVAGAEITLP